MRSGDPTYFNVPEGSVFTKANEVLDLMREIGMQIGQPETYAAQALLPQKKNGDWASLETAIVCARQNLKTATMIACALHDIFVQGVDRVVWTAHEFKTSAEAFRDFRAIVEGHDYFSSNLKQIRVAHGFEGFETKWGSRLDVIARTGKSGRGMGGDRLYVDEALYAQGHVMGALLPTLSARPNAHVIYGSSAGLLDSAYLRGLRDRGRDPENNSLGYVEWTSERRACTSAFCAHKPLTPGCALDDENLWADANPALGRRISLEFVRQEREALSAFPAEFMRERLCWWDDPPEGGEESAIPMDSWHERGDDVADLDPNSAIAFGVDTSWDRLTTWIAAAGYNTDGIPQIQLVPMQAGEQFGTSGVLDWFAQRFTKSPRYPNTIGVGFQASGAPVSTVSGKLVDIVAELAVPFSFSDLGKACGSFYDSVANGPLVHNNDPILTGAVEKANTRPIGDSWVWDRKTSSVDIGGLVAVTIALHILLTEKPRKKKVSRAIGW